MNELTIGDHIGFGGTSYKDFSTALGKMSGAITVRINSLGGDVFDGFGIANRIRAKGAGVIIDGVAASIASVIAVAGTPVKIASNAHIFVHNPSTFTMGDAAEMRSAGDLLDRMTSSLAAAYTRKTGKDDATVRKWMNEESWFDAEEAVAAGLADEIIPESDARVFACLNLAAMPHVPAVLAARIGAAAKPQDLQAKVTQLQAALEGERRNRITAAVQLCISECRLAAGKAATDAIARAMQDETYLAELACLPQNLPGTDPLNMSDPSRESGGDLYARHMAALKRQRGSK